MIAAVALLVAAPVAAHIGPSVRELVEVADVEALAASPDGSQLAFRVQRASLAGNSYRIDWYVIDLASSGVRHVADGGAPIYNDGAIEGEAPAWAADGRSFYYRALVDGAIGIWEAQADGSGNHAIIVRDADVESFELSSDRKVLAFVTGPSRAEIERAEQREYDEGILVDATIDPTQALYRGGFVHGRRASQRLVGRWYQHDGLLWRAPRQRHRVDLATLTETGVEPVTAPALDPLSSSWTAPPMHARGESGALVTLRDSEAGPLLEASDSAGRHKVCESQQCRNGKVVALAWRPASSEILFTRQDEHLLQSLYMWDSRSGHVRLVAAAGGQLSGGRSGSVPCAITRLYAVCVAASAVSPPRLERIGLDDGRRASLFDPNAMLRARPAPQVEQLDLKLDGGRIATGTLLLKPGTQPGRAPLFVNYYYCSGYLRGGVGDAYPLGPLVDAGFVVACLNVVPFKEWGDGADRERAALASVSSLIRLLDRRGWIDPHRVGMGGFSAGSEATMWVAMNSDLLAAAAVASPQYEPAHYWTSSVRGRDFPRILKEFQQVGPPETDPGRWKIISPALNVDQIRAPLLMQLPEQEMRAAMELYAKLSNTRTPVEMYAFPDEAHVKIQPRHQLAVYQRNLDWFRYWLQDYADPNPERAEQFRRWAALRRRSAE